MKKNDNRLFHPGLYAESLRQTRMMGLVYLLLSLIFAILPPLLGSYNTFYPIQAGEQAFVLYFYDFIAPLTMGYTVFGYLTKRNASDFYHSLPVTREAAYFSRAAAVMTYLLGTIAATVAASFMACRFAGSTVNWLQVLPLISYHFAASVLVLSCTLVGLAAAGTYFSSFVVAGLALFLPQMVMYILYTTIDAVAETVRPEALSFLLDIPLNIPAGLIASLFVGGFGLVSDATSYIFYAPAHVYTLALAAITGLAGCIIHNRRRSETARTAAPNRFLQHLYRCLIALPLFLIIGTMIASGERWGNDSESYIILSVVGLLVYFLYELITTRKWRNLWSAAKVLPIVLIAALALPWLGFGIGHAANNDLPAREQVESVTTDIRYRHTGSTNYELIGLSEYEYTDEKMLDLLHEALEMTVEYHEKHGSYIGAVATTTPIEKLYEQDVYSSAGFRTMDVQFNLKNGKDMVRQIRLTPDQYNKYIALRMQDEGFRKIIGTLPEAKQVTGLRLAGHTVNDAPTDVTEITRGMIWEVFCEEYAALTVEEQMMLSGIGETAEYTAAAYDEPVAVENTSAVYQNEFGFEYYDTGNNLQVVGYDGLRAFNNNYKVTSLTPRTLLMMMKYINDIAAEYDANAFDWFKNALREDAQNGSMSFYMNLRVYDPKGEHMGAVELSRTILTEEELNDPERAEELVHDKKYNPVPNYMGVEYLDAMYEVLGILSRGSEEIADLNNPIVLVNHLGWDSYKNYTGYNTSARFVQLSEGDFAELMEVVEPYWPQE